MNVQVVSVTGVGQSDTIKPLPGNPFNVGFGAVASGTVTYSLQHTFDGVNWFDHDTAVGIVDVNDDGNYAFPVAGIRVNVTSGTGSVTLTTIQA